MNHVLMLMQGHGFSVFLCICVTLIIRYWRHLVCICVRSPCVSEGTSCLCLGELSGDREGRTVPFSTLCRTDILGRQEAQLEILVKSGYCKINSVQYECINNLFILTMYRPI